MLIISHDIVSELRYKRRSRQACWIVGVDHAARIAGWLQLIVAFILHGLNERCHHTVSVCLKLRKLDITIIPEHELGRDGFHYRIKVVFLNSFCLDVIFCDEVRIF